MLRVAKMLSSFTETLTNLEKHTSLWTGCLRWGLCISPLPILWINETLRQTDHHLEQVPWGKKKEEDQKTRKNIAQKCYRQPDASPPQEKIILF